MLVLLRRCSCAEHTYVADKAAEHAPFAGTWVSGDSDLGCKRRHRVPSWQRGWPTSRAKSKCRQWNVNVVA